MTGTDVYLLAAFEPYTDPRHPVPINTLIVHAATLLHPELPQPDGGMMYRCLTERPRRAGEIVPVSTLTFELDGGRLWPLVADWERVVEALMGVARAGHCDSMSLGVPDLPSYLIAMGPTTVSTVYEQATGTMSQQGPSERQAALDDLAAHVARFVASGPFWPGDNLVVPPVDREPLQFRPCGTGPSSGQKPTLEHMSDERSNDEPPVSKGIGVAGCYAYVPLGPYGQPRQCHAPVAWTGVLLRLKVRGRPAQAWQAFACGEHHDDLIARRRLLPRDWERLADWREQADRWRPGRTSPASDPYRPPRPLAEGDAAYELVDRAQEWAQGHPGK